MSNPPIKTAHVSSVIPQEVADSIVAYAKKLKRSKSFVVAQILIGELTISDVKREASGE